MTLSIVKSALQINLSWSKAFIDQSEHPVVYLGNDGSLVNIYTSLFIRLPEKDVEPGQTILQFNLYLSNL